MNEQSLQSLLADAEAEVVELRELLRLAQVETHNAVRTIGYILWQVTDHQMFITQATIEEIPAEAQLMIMQDPVENKVYLKLVLPD